MSRSAADWDVQQAAAIAWWPGLHSTRCLPAVWHRLVEQPGPRVVAHTRRAKGVAPHVDEVL